MIRVKIAYDPYHMKTSLNINGQNVKQTARGYERVSQFVKQDIPLQSWIDPILFQNWKGLLWEIIGNSRETEVEFHFQGREIDFIDLKEAMNTQSKLEVGGYPVKVNFPEDKQHFCYDDKNVLKKVKIAYQLIQSDEFKKILDDKIFEVGTDSELLSAYKNLPRKFQDALDGEFRIVFSGMYTCGKSTIINAILGKDLLPTRDGTCTSKVFKIQHDPYVAYAKMSCIDKDGNIVVEEQEYDEEALKDKFNQIFPRGDDDTLLPSEPPSIDTVLISTSMANLYPISATYQQDDMKIVVIDTPGTSSGEGNNQEGGVSHFDIAKGVIESEKKEIVVFATNATVDKDTSIIDFLKMVDEGDPYRAYDQRYLFVLNKADDCSLKSDETWPQKLKGIQKYYTDNGKRAIKNPRFFPTSAKAAFLVRTGRAKGSEYGTIRENYYYHDEDREGYFASETKSNYHFDEFCSTSQVIKDNIKNELAKIEESSLKSVDKRKEEILLHSGIVSLEMAIRDYIEKYAFPLKIQDLLKTYETIFKETNQLLNIAQSNFDKAVKAKNDAEGKRSSEEDKKEAAEKTKKSLENLGLSIQERKKKLDSIIESFELEAERQTEDVKIEMDLALKRAKEVAQNNPKKNTIKKEIRTIIENGERNCQTKINTHFEKGKKETKKLETEIISFFQDAKKMIDFGNDFSIDNTTDFERISTDSISTIKNTGHNIRNPELDKGFILFRPIKNLFVKKTVWQDDGIDIAELDSELYVIRAKFDTNIDAMFDKAKLSLKNASKKLKDNLDKLERKIKDYADQLKRMQNNIEQITADIESKVKFETELNIYKGLLMQIQEHTNFERIEEE